MSIQILRFNLDIAAFTIAVLIATAIVHLVIQRSTGGAGLNKASWIILLLMLVIGGCAAFESGLAERSRLQGMLQGFPPTYSIEASRLGHSSVNFHTDKNDPVYLKLIEAEKQWLKVNPAVNDIYTFSRNEQGKIAFLVDSETDYNHDGQYNEEREQRTPIGEVYDDPTAGMILALDGKSSFDGEPYSDRWGVWVSAFEPILNAAGKVEGALGVDYDASQWVGSIIRSRLAVMGFFAIAIVVLVWSGSIITMMRHEVERRKRTEQSLRESVAAQRGAEAEREKLHEQLIHASRKAGMAEIATGVLHNIGNVLNTVNMSNHVLLEKVRQSKVASLRKAVTMLKDNEAQLPKFLSEDERGRQVPGYLHKLSELLEMDQSEMLGELQRMGESLEHIKAIVFSQQEHAKNEPCMDEPLRGSALFEDALKLNIASCERHQILINREFAELAPVITDKHKLLQILSNLISNAKEATKEAQVESRKINLRLSKVVGEDGGDYIQFAVRDNGVGIARENLHKIFGMGFTTRKQGHGFGLHSAANFAQELGGRLTVQSDGPGQGACFVLEIPMVPGRALTNV